MSDLFYKLISKNWEYDYLNREAGKSIASNITRFYFETDLKIRNSNFLSRFFILIRESALFSNRSRSEWEGREEGARKDLFKFYYTYGQWKKTFLDQDVPFMGQIVDYTAPILYEMRHTPHGFFEQDIPTQPIPKGYEWVKGKKNVENFMKAEKNLDLIANLAKSSFSAFSPLIDPDSLHISYLIEYASEEQIQAIVRGVGDNRKKIRAIFSSLFKKMEASLLQNKRKLIAALEVLSREQLWNILAIKLSNSPQLQKNEIDTIPLKYFLKWKVDLNLPFEFIEDCELLLKYAKQVQSEAEKQPQIVE